MSENEHNNSLIGHLIELRSRLLRIVMVVLLIFISSAYFANDIYVWVSKPLTDALPSGASMIAKDVASPLLAPFKLTFMLSIYLSMPFILYQIWSFIAPGLYKHEKRLIAPLLISSTLLFYAGVAFCYFVLFNLVFSFFAAVAPTIVAYTPDITSYLDFVLMLFFAFGLAFEIPVVILLLIWTGVTSADKLREKRPYIILAAFVIGMFLTPPDMISQTLLAIPMWLLFEVGLLFARFYTPKTDDEEESDQQHIHN